MNPLRSDRIHERQSEVLLALLTEAIAKVEAGYPLDTFLSQFYRQNSQFGSRDRRLLSGALFSFFRWKGWLDRITCDVKSAAVVAYLLDAAELHPAITRLATATPLPESLTTPMGTLTLEEKCSRLAAASNVTLTTTQLVPDWSFTMLGHPSPQLMETFQIPPPTWLRIQPGKANAVLPALAALNIHPSPHKMLPSAVAVPRGTNLRSLPGGVRPLVDVQDLASQVATLVCRPGASQKWWDACAGSGGKTFHLAEIAGPSTSILATDIRPTILKGLNLHLQETGIKTITSAVWDGVNQPPPDGPFDGILLDAPCSGMGTWHRNPDARWRLTQERVRELASIQARLLKACATRLNPGGILVYATCTLTAIENEELIKQFLNQTPGFKLDPFTNPLDHSPCNGLLPIMPWTGPCNGMFIARMKFNSPPPQGAAFSFPE